MTVSIVDAVMQRLAKTSGLGAVEQARVNMDLVKDVIFSTVAELEESANTRTIINCLPMVDKCLAEIPNLEPRMRMQASLRITELAAETICSEWNDKSYTSDDDEILFLTKVIATQLGDDSNSFILSAYRTAYEACSVAVRNAFDNDTVPLEVTHECGVVQFKAVDLITEEKINTDVLDLLRKEILQTKAKVRECFRNLTIVQTRSRDSELIRARKLVTLNRCWEDIKEIEHDLSLCNQLDSFDDETLSGIESKIKIINGLAE